MAARLSDPSWRAQLVELGRVRGQDRERLEQGHVESRRQVGVAGLVERAGVKDSVPAVGRL